MMRGPITLRGVRRAGGQIALTCEAVPKVLRPAWQKVPFLRGAFALVDAMALGTKALFWAAKVAEQDTASPAKQGEVRAAEESVGPALGTAAAAPEGRSPAPAPRASPMSPSAARWCSASPWACA
jgi:uncharacterized protein YqhQ